MTAVRRLPRPRPRLRRAPLAGAACLVALLGAAGPASAARCKAPPGTSAIDQYCEAFPTAGGSTDTEERGGSRLQGRLSPGTAKAFAKAGSDGRTLLDLPAAAGSSRTKPGTSTGNGRNSRARPGQPGENANRGTADGAPSSNPFRAVRSAVQSGTTLGGEFVWILIAIALALVAVAWVRYRRSP
jgi:hypothetical protein